MKSLLNGIIYHLNCTKQHFKANRLGCFQRLYLESAAFRSVQETARARCKCRADTEGLPGPVFLLIGEDSVQGWTDSSVLLLDLFRHALGLWSLHTGRSRHLTSLAAGAATYSPYPPRLLLLRRTWALLKCMWGFWIWGQFIACSTLSSTTDLAFDDENSSCAWFNSLTQNLEDFQQKGEKSGSQFTSPCHTTFLKPVSLPTHPLSPRSLESWPQHRLPLRKNPDPLPKRCPV